MVIVGSAALIVSRLDDLRSERRIDSLASREAVFLVNNLLLVGLCVVIFWGTFFPLISEALTGERSSLGSPWFDRYTTPLAILLVLFTGIGPLLAWRRVSAGALWRLVRGAARRRGGAVAGRRAHRRRSTEPVALVLFAFAFFALAALAAEFWRGAAAQRALDGRRLAGAALARVVGRNRRRYGGYIVHAGIAILFIAVAASSSFQTSADLRLRPATRRRGRRLHGHLREPTRSIDPAEQRLTFGAVLGVDRDGERSRRCTHRATTTVDRGDRHGRAASSRARRPARSAASRRAGGDLWTAMRPDLAPLDGVIDGADRRLAGRPSRVGPRADARGSRDARLRRPPGPGDPQPRERCTSRGPLPVDFRVNVNPFVIWIWIGGAIAVRRADRASGRRPRRGAAGSPTSTRRGSRATWAAPESSALHREAPGVAFAVEVVLALVICVALAWFVTAPLRRRPRASGEGGRGPRARRPRGAQGGALPADPRRRARPRAGQALAGRLAPPRRRAAPRGDRGPERIDAAGG